MKTKGCFTRVKLLIQGKLFSFTMAVMKNNHTTTRIYPNITTRLILVSFNTKNIHYDKILKIFNKIH